MNSTGNKGGILRALAIDGVIVAVLAIIMGVIFVAVPVSSGVVICIVSGILLMCVGAAAMAGVFIYGPILAGYSMAVGIVLAMCGLLCIVQPALVMGFLTVIFGIFIVIDAGTSLADGIHCIRHKVQGGVPLTVLSAILLVLGILVMFGPIETVMVFLGWVLIVDGIFDIITMAVFGSRVREAKRAFGTDDIIDSGER